MSDTIIMKSENTVLLNANRTAVATGKGCCVCCAAIPRTLPIVISSVVSAGCVPYAGGSIMVTDPGINGVWPLVFDATSNQWLLSTTGGSVNYYTSSDCSGGPIATDALEFQFTLSCDDGAGLISVSLEVLFEFPIVNVSETGTVPIGPPRSPIIIVWSSTVGGAPVLLSGGQITV